MFHHFPLPCSFSGDGHISKSWTAGSCWRGQAVSPWAIPWFLHSSTLPLNNESMLSMFSNSMGSNSTYNFLLCVVFSWIKPAITFTRLPLTLLGLSKIYRLAICGHEPFGFEKENRCEDPGVKTMSILQAWRNWWTIADSRNHLTRFPWRFLGDSIRHPCLVEWSWGSCG